MRYRSQKKVSVAMPNILGNHSMPVYTYRWKDIYASDNKAALEAILPKGDKYECFVKKLIIKMAQEKIEKSYHVKMKE